VAKSGILLEAQSQTLKGAAPNGSGSKTLNKVLPKNLINKTGGANMTLWADCGDAARTVMGAGQGNDWSKMVASYKIPVKAPGAAKAKIETKSATAIDPEDAKKEIFSKKFNIADGDAALAHYQALSAAQQDKVDQELGINRYAVAKPGQGYTISSGGAAFPGAGDPWNFHWAGVVMAAGSDRVALENYAVGADVENEAWRFQMYGSAAKPGQTFHEQHLASELHGQAPTTMSVHKRK